ncbi:MAG: EamA family transporter [Pyrinomonadaceae bacterium]|jgi:drug/metabolite transporter (DMT)-like permease|nr:EamA family transporter [Pyrinomonadaceae bacterium]
MNIIVWLLLCVIWGTTWFFIKVGLRDLPPISFAGARFVSACLILLAVIWLQKIPLPKTKRDWTLLAVTGFLQFSFNYSMVFWSEQYISSGLAAVLQATIPAFGLLMAWVHLPQERITWQKIVAIILGVIGVATIFVEQLHVNDLMAFAGCVAIVAGAFAAAEASVLTKSFGASLHPATLLFGQMVCGLLPIMLVGFFKEGSPLNFQWTTSAVFAVLYLAVVGTIAAFWLYYWLLQRVESTKAMTIALVTPLVAVFVGAIALDEKFLPQTYFGGALILASVCLTAFRKRPKIVDQDYQAAD